MQNQSTLFVPSLPTLWPEMLLQPRKETTHFPFCAANANYFYFARNAIWHVIRALGLNQGEILVPAYHHGVEIEAIIDAGAQVKFYRVGEKWDVDLADVERQIGAKTRALYLIHYAGFPGPVQEMRRLAEQFGIFLIEDCALSLLSKDGDIPLGATGDISIYCLYKVLPVPNGGALVINDRHHLTLMSNRLSTPPITSTVNHSISSLLQNLEMRGGNLGRNVRKFVRSLGQKTVQASNIERIPTGTQHFNRNHVSIGISRLTKQIMLSQDYEQIVSRRRNNYHYLLNHLGNISQPLFESLSPGVSPLFYPLLVENKSAVMESLAAQGIETIDFWRYFHPACEANRFPEVAKLRRNVLEIPCHQDISPELLDRMVSAIRDVLTRGN